GDRSFVPPPFVRRGERLSSVGTAEVAHLALRLFLRPAVPLLDLAFELFGAAVDAVEVIIGELAPLLLHLAANLLPVALQLIHVHDMSFLDAIGCVRVEVSCETIGQSLITTVQTCVGVTAGWECRVFRRAAAAARG